MSEWFGRPVLHVKDVDASLGFYQEKLGFTSPWRYEEDGKAKVAQVEGKGSAIILASTWPEKAGRGTIFVSVNLEPKDQIAALDLWRKELEAKAVPVREDSWGYRVLV